MSTLYDVDYQQQAIELLPPDKRSKNIAAFLWDCLKSTCQYLRDATLDDYRNGSTVGAWTAGNYSRGVKVNYKNGIYVSLAGGNTATPTDADYWYQQQPDFVGLNERLQYNGINLTLTYALNKWFGGTFRQPGMGTSDIYISTNIIEADFFLVGADEAETTAVGVDTPDGFVGIDNYSNAPQNNCYINVPKALFSTIAGTDNAATALIESFVNNYIIAGITYKVQTY